MFKDYRIDPGRKVCLQWNLKRLRNFMGLTQKDLAMMLGYSEEHAASAVGNLESHCQDMNDRFYLALVALCYKFYELQPDIYSETIKHEITLDFTDKRPHGPKYQSYPTLYECAAYFGVGA